MQKVILRIVSEDGREMVEEADKEVVDWLFNEAERLSIPPGILFNFVIADGLDYVKKRLHNGN